MHLAIYRNSGFNLHQNENQKKETVSSSFCGFNVFDSPLVWSQSFNLIPILIGTEICHFVFCESKKGKQCDAEQDQFDFLTLLCKAADSHQCSDCHGDCDHDHSVNPGSGSTPQVHGDGHDADSHDMEETEGSIPSLPSLSTQNVSNSAKTPITPSNSCFTSPSTVSDQTVLTNPHSITSTTSTGSMDSRTANSTGTSTHRTHSTHKVPQLPIFPNFAAQTQSLPAPHRSVGTSFTFNLNPFSGTSTTTTTTTAPPTPQQLLALSAARQKGQDLAQKQFASLLQGTGPLSLQNGVIRSSLTSQVTFPK